MANAIYTLGHSNTTLDVVLRLLAQHQIESVVDVRSQPFSRFNPQFNRPNLSQYLRQKGIAYLFLGRELGARPEDPACYQNGRALYSRIAATSLFALGIQKLVLASEQGKIVLLCAEKDPLSCHRTILVGRFLHERGTRVLHILEDGSLETQDALLARLLTELHLAEQDLFRTSAEIIASAYEIQAERIQFAANLHHCLTGTEP